MRAPACGQPLAELLLGETCFVLKSRALARHECSADRGEGRGLQAARTAGASLPESPGMLGRSDSHAPARLLSSSAGMG